MKTVLFTLPFAVFVSANVPRFLYAFVGNQYLALGSREVADHEFLTPSGPKELPVPIFTLSNGILSTGEGVNSKVMGMQDGFLVIGSKSEVSPFKVQLDKKSKILDLFITQCNFSSRSIRNKFEYNNGTIRAKQCYTSELYLLTSKDILKYALHPSYDIKFSNFST